MTERTPKTVAPTWRTRARDWALPLAIGAIAIPLAISLWPPSYRSETRTVQIDEVDLGAGLEVAEIAEIRSVTGADYKGRRFRETTLEITVSRRPDDSGLLSPELSATFTAGGSRVRCEIPERLEPDAARSVTLSLPCQPFVDFEGLNDISDLRVAH